MNDIAPIAPSSAESIGELAGRHARECYDLAIRHAIDMLEIRLKYWLIVDNKMVCDALRECIADIRKLGAPA